MNLNRSSSHSHSVCRLFTVVLLGLFLIFLLVMLLFSAQAYRTADKRNSAEQQPVYRFLLHICQISPA